jgi:hypothetical protein
MHIVISFFITCHDPTSMREHEGMVCIRWSNLVVVVNCDRNFMTCYGVCQSVVTSLGIKRMHVLYFLDDN